MDRETRNRIQRATQDARALLEREYAEQLAGTFDIRLDGTTASAPGGHLDPWQRLVRAKLVTAIAHLRAAGHGKDAVAAYVREAAFTTLNRFVALKMLEARGLVQECLSRGEESSGFKEFVGLAPGLVQLPDHGYRLYVDSLFDEIGREVRVLFDRRDAASLLWPRRQPLLDLLAILNTGELASVWGEDETIGWVYQYFNSDEERRQMRAESQAPRNSRELAVRNQFFTPRYVVQFLTDNTLGRIWYEMRRGETALRDLDYRVRRRNEVFLAEDEEAPATSGNDDDVSQEELLRRPVYLAFRRRKDPRDIRVLDPACGSGHFLLYAFDLLLVIYEEAWADETAPKSKVTGKTLREDYADLASVRAAAPGLILRHNLHGIDIDARCAQIAALALWMRAQRAFKDIGFAREARPPIQKTNIVVAEPMPGEPELRREFIATLDTKVGQLIQRVFDRMELAGEAGSLLRIEDDIRDAVREIYGGHGRLFQASDEERWRRAEDDVLRALRAYAERAANGRAFQRRLFSEDAARGLGFIDCCSQGYDIVLMNPPFGHFVGARKRFLAKAYSGSHSDISSAFVSRAVELGRRGLLGVVASRAFLLARRQEDFRADILLPGLELLADLGGGVMDGALVDAQASVLRLGSPPGLHFVVIDLRQAHNRADMLLDSIKHRRVIFANRRLFRRLPSSRIAYSVPESILRLLDSPTRFEPAMGTAREGMKTFDNDRFLRLWWEVSPERIGWSEVWRRYAKGGEFAFYFSDLPLVLRWDRDGRELCAVNESVNGSTAQVRQASEYWGRAGITYTRRSAAGFSARILPAHFIFSDRGPAILNASEAANWYSLGWVNSRLIRYLIHAQANASDFMTGIIKNLPWKEPSAAAMRAVEHATRQIAMAQIAYPNCKETSPYFIAPGEPSSKASARAIQGDPALVSVIDKTIDELYGIDSTNLVPEIADEDAEQEAITEFNDDTSDRADATDWDGWERFLHWSVGVAMGRFDVQRATSDKPWPINNTSDPFHSLFPCPPGMLTGADGLPVDASPVGYPIDFPRGGILVDDEGHENDLLARIREVFKEVFGGDAHLRLREAAETVETRGRELRRWLADSFFDDHIKRYSNSRRKAPIYWQLATPAASYSVWVYYHRFTRDTLYRVLNDYVTPKLAHEERKLINLTQDAGPSPAASQRKEIDAQERLVEELRALRKEVVRVAPLWNPDLNDGVIINFAALWRLVPQNNSWQQECKAVWDKLVGGEYDWAHLAMHLWPERVVPKCAMNRSLAIAHGLEEVLWEENSEGKWKPKKVATEVIDRLIAERSSAALKAALDDFLRSPAPTSPSVGRRRSGARLGEANGGVIAASRSCGKVSSAESSVNDATVAAVRDAIAAGNGGASKAEVMEATGISSSDWNAAINALLGEGIVIKTGAARGTRYRLAAEEDPA